MIVSLTSFVQLLTGPFSRDDHVCLCVSACMPVYLSVCACLPVSPCGRASLVDIKTALSDSREYSASLLSTIVN